MDVRVCSICQREFTGYGNNASLSKAFKREFGISPGAYRRARGDATHPGVPPAGAA